MTTVARAPGLSPAGPSNKYQIVCDMGECFIATMSAETWIGLPDHPRQRDTERQARRPHWAYAKRSRGPILEALRHVVAADWQGQLWKVDGHARALLWARGELPVPDEVKVTVHRVTSYQELLELYSVFDTQSAAESLADKVAGAFRQAGIKDALTSKRIKHGFLVSAFNIALRGKGRAEQDKRHTKEIDVYRAVEVFKDELLLLDSVDPQPEVFQTGVVAAALIALSLDPADLAFFERLSERRGNKLDGKMDPVEAVLSYLNTIKGARSSFINSVQAELCGRTLNALQAWKAGPEQPANYWFNSQVRAIRFEGWIARMKQRKAIDADPHL